MNSLIPDYVLQFGSAQRAPRRRLGALVRSNRFTFPGTLVVAIGIPHLLHPLFRDAHLLTSLLNTGYGISLATSFFALLNAHVILRRVGVLPLVEDKVLILPAFLASYAVVMAVATFGFGRFGLYLVCMSFVFGLAWYYFIALVRVRLYHPRMAFVGGLPSNDELLSGNIEWVPLFDPVIPRDIMGIVFDRGREMAPGFDPMFSRAILRNIPIYESSHFQEMLSGRVSLETPPHEVFGRLLPFQPFLRVKRIVDTFFVIPGLLLAMPVMLVAGLLIKLESPGPVIYRQHRIGYQGCRFVCYKLRSMRTGMAGPAYTEDADPRITRIGRFIRKWRIDELPQLFNVLKGDMSWIGPRPEAVSLARSYQKVIPYYPYRHSVRPGITGWAAVHHGNVALVEAAARKLEYDFYYVKNFSIWLDMLIVLMTIRTVVTGFGSK